MKQLALCYRIAAMEVIVADIADPMNSTPASDWATSNNLSLNLSQSEEIVFVDKPKKHKFNIPDTLQSAMFVLWTFVWNKLHDDDDDDTLYGLKTCAKYQKHWIDVTFTNGLSVTPHVQHLATSNAETLYALKILRAHGLCRMAIQAVFRSVILARLLYTPHQHGGALLEPKTDKKSSFLRRSAWAGFYSSDLPSFDDVCIQAHQNLFNKVLHNSDHVLHRLLQPVAHTSHTGNYCLRPRAHDRSLTNDWHI